MTLPTGMSGREDLPVSKKVPVGYHAERPVVRGEPEFIGKGRTDRCGFLVAETEGIGTPLKYLLKILGTRGWNDNLNRNKDISFIQAILMLFPDGIEPRSQD